jgi:hypothetical protein
MAVSDRVLRRIAGEAHLSRHDPCRQLEKAPENT